MPRATALAAAPGLPATNRRESDDAYGGVIAVLNDRWRVIACRDGIQWILQRQDATRSLHGTAWRGQSYCRLRDGLLSACNAHAGAITASALAILNQLPARFPEGEKP